MDVEKPQDYVEALKKLEGFPLMGMVVQDGHLVFTSMSRRVALPLSRGKGAGCDVCQYGLNKLDVLVDYVEYKDHLGCIRLFDENGDIIAHVTLKIITRAEWLFSELQDRNLHDSVIIDPYKKYVLLADDVVFTEESHGLTGVFVHWPSLDSPVSRIIDQGYVVSILTDAGGAVELFFDEDEDGENDVD